MILGRLITRRGFTIAEAAIVTLVLAVSVPPAAFMLQEVGRDQSDAIQSARAVFLAEAVLEQVVADVASDDAGLGFGALASAASYESGVRSRLSWVETPYVAAGLSWDLAVGGLVGPEGNATGDVDQDVFRMITVTVTVPLSTGDSDFSVVTMVGEL